MATEKENIEAIREGIKATMVSHTKTDDGEPVKQSDKEEKKEVEVKEPEVDEETEVKEEEVKEEIETKDDDEEKEVEEESVEKLKKTIEKLQRRIGKTTAEKKQIAKDLEAAKAKLVDEGKDNILTEEDVERRAEEKATQKDIERAFTKACNKLADEATKLDKNFPVKVKEMGEEVGGIPPAMIGLLEDLDNGGAILNYFTDNTDDYEKIRDLPTGKMALELAKISNKIKPKPKAISKVPDPPEKVLGGKASRDTNVMPDPKNVEAWIEWRNKQVAEKRANGKSSLR